MKRALKYGDRHAIFFFLRFHLFFDRERQQEREHERGEWERENGLPAERGA